MFADMLAPCLLAAALVAADAVAPARAAVVPPTAAAPAEAQAPAAAGSPAEAAPAGLADAVARADAAWPRRDQPGGVEAVQAALDEAARLAPGAYEVLWRRARLETWLSEDPAIPDGEKSRLGKRAWELGDKAAAADPSRPEGWFYAMAGMGNYSLGIGILTALAQGIEGKFKDRLGRAERIAPGFDSGAIPTAWGRFWFKLPWPKFDARKSRKALEDALAMNPDNVRARVYLGDLHLDQGRKDEAREAYRAALAKPPGVYDAPEERRWQGVARAALEKLGR
jgi:tetratricopeptide (TPR) repeat protein